VETNRKKAEYFQGLETRARQHWEEANRSDRQFIECIAKEKANEVLVNDSELRIKAVEDILKALESDPVFAEIILTSIERGAMS
jgi:hypothetical protein